MSGFKVIIVGGGLAGLGLAHCLSKAGIDYVVLERSDGVVPKGGASMCLWPNNVRVMDQLGLLKEVEGIDGHIEYKINVRRDGSVIAENNMFERIRTDLGHPWMSFHRVALHKLLLDNLPESATRVLSGKAVTSIETHKEGVKVTCADESVHEGSIVVGADGANSSVRRCMARSAVKQEPFTTSYRALYGTSHLNSGMKLDTLYEMHGDKCSIQVIPMAGMQQFVIYERLPKSTKGSIRYSEEEKNKFAEEYGDFHITPTLKFKDIWATCSWSFMSGLEEGIAETWHGDRVVLIGDSVHKMTPNVGLGLNSGLQSAVVLTNGLRRLLLSELEPDTESLNQVFIDYHNLRRKNATNTEALSGLYTRVVAWNNPVWKVVDQYIAPKLNGDIVLLDHILAPLVAKQDNTLEFLDENNFQSGRVPWRQGRRTCTSSGTIGKDDVSRQPI